MKKLIYIAIALFITASASAQIKLEAEYEADLNSVQLENGKVKLFTVNRESTELIIYNIDMSIWKTIPMHLPEGHYFNVIKDISLHTFNDDEKVEVIYGCYHYEGDFPMGEGDIPEEIFDLTIIDESGKELLRVTDVKSYHLLTKGDIKKIVIKTSPENSLVTTTKVYSLK